MLIISSCSLPSNLDQLKAVQYIENGKTINPDASVENQIGSFRIIYGKNSTAYEVWSINYKALHSTVNGKNINTELVPTTDTTFKYFIVKNNDSIGLAYDSLTTLDKGKLFQLDSLLERLAIDKLNMKIFALDLGRATSIEQTGQSGKVEKYFTKKSEGDADSIYRYYDKNFKDINFSFAPELDKLNKSKLYKTRFIYLPKDKSKAKQELICEIKEVQLTNKSKMMELMRRFEKEYDSSVK